MITVETKKKASLRTLRYKNYADFKRVLDYYDRYDVSAREKDFHYAEHCNYMIEKIHKRNGIAES